MALAVSYLKKDKQRQKDPYIFLAQLQKKLPKDVYSYIYRKVQKRAPNFPYQIIRGKYAIRQSTLYTLRDSLIGGRPDLLLQLLWTPNLATRLAHEARVVKDGEWRRFFSGYKKDLVEPRLFSSIKQLIVCRPKYSFYCHLAKRLGSVLSAEDHKAFIRCVDRIKSAVDRYLDGNYDRLISDALKVIDERTGGRACYGLSDVPWDNVYESLLNALVSGENSSKALDRVFQNELVKQSTIPGQTKYHVSMCQLSRRGEEENPVYDNYAREDSHSQGELSSDMEIEQLLDVIFEGEDPLDREIYTLKMIEENTFEEVLNKVESHIKTVPGIRTRFNKIKKRIDAKVECLRTEYLR